MVRNLSLIALLFSVFPAAAQVTNCAPWPTSGQQCNDGPAGRRAPGTSLMLSDTDLFRRQPDGSIRMRRIRPLTRPTPRPGTALKNHQGGDHLQVEDLALYVDRDLFRQVPLRNRSGDLGDIPHLRCKILSHQVHIAGEILPYTATPTTRAWPPNLPSVPTSWATRATSDANELS